MHFELAFLPLMRSNPLRFHVGHLRCAYGMQASGRGRRRQRNGASNGQAANDLQAHRREPERSGFPVVRKHWRDVRSPCRRGRPRPALLRQPRVAAADPRRRLPRDPGERRQGHPLCARLGGGDGRRPRPRSRGWFWPARSSTTRGVESATPNAGSKPRSW